MALGAITQTAINPAGNTWEVLGGLRVTVNDIVGDSSYPTGGSTLTPAQLGLQTVLFAICSCKLVGANGPSEAYYNTSTGKLQCFTATGEVANTTSLSGATIEVVAFGF